MRKCGEESVPEIDSEGRLRTFSEKSWSAQLRVSRPYPLRQSQLCSGGSGRFVLVVITTSLYLNEVLSENLFLSLAQLRLGKKHQPQQQQRLLSTYQVSGAFPLEVEREAGHLTGVVLGGSKGRRTVPHTYWLPTIYM